MGKAVAPAADFELPLRLMRFHPRGPIERYALQGAIIKIDAVAKVW
jgi:hypothetical protein